MTTMEIRAELRRIVGKPALMNQEEKIRWRSLVFALQKRRQEP